MLYDKRWDAKVEQKADPLSLEALIAWLEKQPADKIYCYNDAGQCLAAQYCKSIGVSYASPFIFDEPKANDSFEYKMEWIGLKNPRNFGAALERARALV